MKRHHVRPRETALVGPAAIIAGALVAGALVPANQGFAVELGNARVKSAVNSPLEVEIPLLEIEAGELDALKPQLPANSRSAELASASIELARSADGAPVLRVRSAEPVTVSDVRFVVVADWGKGRKFREYTVSLIEPAGSASSASTAPAVAAPPAATTTPPPVSVTTFSTGGSDASEPALSESAMQPASQTDSERATRATRTVRAGETLMSISREWSARTGATLSQTMLGIFRANPQAFGPRGMSELFVGSELVLPDAQELTATRAAVASNEVGRTLGIWGTSGAGSTQGNAAAADTRTFSTASGPITNRIVTDAPASTAPAPTPTSPASRPSAPAATPATSPAAATPPTTAPAAAVPVVPPAEGTEPSVAEIEKLQSEIADKTRELEAANTEITALKSRVRGLEALAARIPAEPKGWVGEARRLGAMAWWSIPLLLLTTLGFLGAFLLKGRRPKDAESTDEAPTETGTADAGAAEPDNAEMTLELPPIKASRSEAPAMPDVLLGETSRPAAQPSRASSYSPESVAFVPGTPLPEEDLEGDPPPVDEAGSKINLARAFIEMGHHDAAILELQAALRMGDETQRAEAIRLLDSLPKS